MLYTPEKEILAGVPTFLLSYLIDLLDIEIMVTPHPMDQHQPTRHRTTVQN